MFGLFRHAVARTAPYRIMDETWRQRYEQLLSEKNDAVSEKAKADDHNKHIEHYTDFDAWVLNYRRAHFEMTGRIAPGTGLPQASRLPPSTEFVSYRDKMVRHLNLAGKGAELGPLNLPMLTKEDASGVLYVDHLSTDGLHAKYPELNGILDVDRPIIDDSIEATLLDDGPLDYMVASQVMEHVPNPIKWLKEASAVLKFGGLFAIALPDRRFTFDFFRPESRPSDMVSAYVNNAEQPDMRALYDHFSQVTTINMHFAFDDSKFPVDVISSRGADQPRRVCGDPMATIHERGPGYIDCHAWVFTPVTFLLLMAQLATDGFLNFRLKYFYPTEAVPDRGNSAFISIFENVGADADREEMRNSFLEPLIVS